MTGQSTERRGSGRRGDRGEWYLRLLGIDGAGGPKTLREVARTHDTTQTTELVTEMWDRTSELPAVDAAADPLTDWQPHELSPTAASGRRVRWPIVVMAFLIGLAAAVALWWMPQMSERRAADHAELMRNSLNALYADLAETQAALAVATEPASEAIDLGSVAIGLTGIADSAARLLDVANQPVPSPLPLTESAPFDDLEAHRDGLEPLAAEATAIRSAVAGIADYRLAFKDVLIVDELPLTADSATITEQGIKLAQALADSVAALNTMPTEGPFAQHRALVDEAVTGFAQWQEDYLSALRAGDAQAATIVTDELQTIRADLADAIVAPLAGLRSEIDGRILDLADRLNRAAAALP